MPKVEKEKAESMWQVRVSANYVKPTVKGKPPCDRNGNPLPILTLVAFADDEKRKKQIPFYGDEEITLSEEEYRSACFQKVPLNINPSGVIPHPFVVCKEVS